MPELHATTTFQCYLIDTTPLPPYVLPPRYQVLEQVGAAAFSRAVQAYDTLERRLVCLKVVKVGRGGRGG